MKNKLDTAPAADEASCSAFSKTPESDAAYETFEDTTNEVLRHFVDYEVSQKIERRRNAAWKEAMESAAQKCRYYLKHQDYPSRWEDKSNYQQGVQIACENIEAAILEASCENHAGDGQLSGLPAAHGAASYESQD